MKEKNGNGRPDDASQSGSTGDRRRRQQNLLKAIEDFAARNGVPEEKIPGFAGQLLAFFERLTPSPVTRRDFLRLSAAGTSAFLLNSLLLDSSCSGGSGGIVACNPPKGTTTPKTGVVPATVILPDSVTFSASVLRRDDMLALKFDFYNLKLQDASLVRVNPGKAVFIVVTLAHGNDYSPQNIGEEAYLETAPEISTGPDDFIIIHALPSGGETPAQPGAVGARFAGPSRLAFKISYTAPIPFTMAELLAWEKYEMSVSPTALPPQQFSSLPALNTGTSQSQALVPVEPAMTETALEVPWQLVMSPSAKAGWAHAALPVARNGRTELWHTRLGVRVSDAAHPGRYLVDEKDSFYRTLRAIWSYGFERGTTPDANDASPFRMSLSKNDRWQLVRLMSDYGIQLSGSAYYKPQPLQVERLMLSTLGAWLNSRGEWPDAPASADLDILEWRHIATMGRDGYVRVVYKGFLFPTGHAATLVKVTERKFQAVPDGGPLAGQPAAYLRQRFYIVVRQPIKAYPAHASQPYGGREWPFVSARLTTLITPILDNPADPAYDLVDKGQKAFWPRAGKQDFLFHIVATDGDGQVTEFASPLAFISDTLQQADDVASFLEPAVTAYKAGSENQPRRERPFQGQKVAFAPSSKVDGVSGGKPGDTSAEVKTLVLGATLPVPSGASLPDGQARFFPTWQEAEVRLPAAEQAVGSALPGPVVIQLHPSFRDSGFSPAANPGYVWAKLKNPVGLSFDGAGDKSGGLVTPNTSIGGLSRSIGVVGGNVGSAPT